jgi:ribosome biogenesis GTPase
MIDDPLGALGWKPFFEQQVDPDGRSPAIIVRVSSHHGSQVLVVGEAGEFRIPVQNALAAGSIAVGDWLVLDADDHRAIQRLERKSELCRKAPGDDSRRQIIAANIDTVFIVTSCNEDFSVSRIERYLALAMKAGITPVVVVTKTDLGHDLTELRQQAGQLHEGLAVEFLDARDPGAAGVLSRWCGAGQTIALVGYTGVGNSTFANSLGAGDQATRAISEYDGKGRHTTMSRSLHLLPSGGVLIDNPGVREVQLPGCKDGVADVFDDVVSLMSECRFNNCRHEGDAGCAVKAAITSGELDESRFDSYQKLHAEQARHAKTLAARRDRERSTTRTQRSAVDKKRRGRDPR